MSENKIAETLPREQVIRNRIKLIAIMAVFALPVLIAYGGFLGGWFTDIHRVNKGDLMTPVIPVSEWRLSMASGEAFATEQRWWLVLVRPVEQCDSACEMQLYTLQQTWIALGKNQERVHTAVWGDIPADKLPNITKILKSDASVSPAFYIVDPLGNVMMKYAIPVTQQEAIDRAKDMRTDFSKLLRFSRIG